MSAYRLMRQAETIPHRDVVEFVRDRGLHGWGAGWIDIHPLASALVGRFHLWTAGRRLAAMAYEPGVGHEMS